MLGLRHASDPDHLVAVTSLVAADGGDTRGAARLGAWWGLGHASMLFLIGLPLIVFKSELPVWLEAGAEKAIGVVIILLALRVIWKWVRGDYRAGRHSHAPPATPRIARTVTFADGDEPRARAPQVRTPRQALGIGLLHGLAGTGAVVAAPAGGAADPARGGAGAGRVRADVDRLDGDLHDRLRLGA